MERLNWCPPCGTHRSGFQPSSGGVHPDPVRRGGRGALEDSDRDRPVAVAAWLLVAHRRAPDERRVKVTVLADQALRHRLEDPRDKALAQQAALRVSAVGVAAVPDDSVRCSSGSEQAGPRSTSSSERRRTRVNERADAMRWVRGPVRYQVAMVAELGVFRAVPYRIVLDGEQHELEAMLVAVGNGPPTAGACGCAPPRTCPTDCWTSPWCCR